MISVFLTVPKQRNHITSKYFQGQKKTPTPSKPVFLLLRIHDKEHGAANDNILHRNPNFGIESCTAASYNEWNEKHRKTNQPVWWRVEYSHPWQMHPKTLHIRPCNRKPNGKTIIDPRCKHQVAWWRASWEFEKKKRATDPWSQLRNQYHEPR